MTHSIIPSSGNFGNDWPKHLNFTQGISGSISVGGWTVGNEGFIQQTFLGASIRNFDISAGFGDSTSALSVSLVNDEYNKSDGTLAGNGDDVYHSGEYDNFAPPVVGSPVFFKFGKNFATIEQAWRKTFDDTYSFTTIPPNTIFPEVTISGPFDYHSDGFYLKELPVNETSNVWVDKSSLLDPNNNARGKDHFIFGGILQSYTQNRGPDGNPLYSAIVQDPREILSNVAVILSDYAGTTYNLKNIINVYGFLEYDPSDALQNLLNSTAIDKSILKKIVDPITSNVIYHGVSTNTNTLSNLPVDCYLFPPNTSLLSIGLPPTFPITGQGFSRKSEQGMPLYRIDQALTALFEYNGNLPAEYKQSGFGGIIDFRGYKYVVDFSGIPFNKIPPMFFLNFNQIDLLSLAQELCDIISHDLFVSLLPIIDHPACKWLHEKNVANINVGNFSDIITGIIRVDTIDKSKQPQYGAIKSYLDNLSSRGIEVENQDIGFEVSNVVTDRFIVGAQEVDMYYFNNNKDRDHLELRKFKNGLPNKLQLLQGSQWNLTASLSQQILPFYGFLDKNVPTIPRGFGSYQQIMLDSSSVDAHGVGNYYIATELELRAAAVSYEVWSEFLSLYDERYLSRIDDRAPLQIALARKITSSDVTSNSDAFQSLMQGGEYAVDVPRCVFNSEKQYMGTDGYPASPCSPPYGYPLYYKRAEKIGIPSAGVLDILNAKKRMISNYVRSKSLNKELRLKSKQNQAEIQRLINLRGETQEENEISSYNKSIKELESLESVTSDSIRSTDNFAILKDNILKNQQRFKYANKLAKESMKNSRKVYAFLKEIADKYLGKTFLVKIPKLCNLNYSSNIITNPMTNEISSGPFGFRPQSPNVDNRILGDISFTLNLNLLRALSNNSSDPYNMFEHYLRYSAYNSSLYPFNLNYRYEYGALKNNFNPISERWEFNYSPEPQGGFFNFAMFDKNLSFVESQNVPNAQLPLSSQQFLSPKNLTNFIESNGRIGAYVRYDNSQYLTLKNVSRNSFTQEFVNNGNYVPDLLEEIDNVDQDNARSFDTIAETLAGGTKPKSIAFVKCELDSTFYIVPQVTNINTRVFGRNTKALIVSPNISFVTTTGIDGCPSIEKSYSVPSHPMVPDNGGDDGTYVLNEDFLRYFNPATQSHIINTNVDSLDSNHVYCLITIPGKVEPSIDARYLDGPYQAMNAAQFKNLLTADVVKGVAGFEKPTPFGKPIKLLNNQLCEREEFTAAAINESIAAANKIIKGTNFGNPEVRLNYTEPSPVYPDFVILPLMSNERCYGPWLSSITPNNSDSNQIRYYDIGGKIEFEKDENLAPWNYAGFQLMNEAGSLKAQFSNSLMLFVERGGYVIPEAPTGIALAKALQNGGPLITSISVSVSDKISTTVKMDLYTSRFGKLQKHKESSISQIVRERQKSIDSKNILIRKGLGKIGFSRNFVSENNGFSDLIRSSRNDILPTTDSKLTINDNMIATVTLEKQINKKENSTSALLSKRIIDMGILPDKVVEEAASHMGNLELNTNYYNSAGGDLTNIFEPYSLDVYHPNMVSFIYVNTGILQFFETL